jgi:hypothetical protein
MHLLIQPDAAGMFILNPVLRDQGLLSRVILASVATLAGTRLYRDADAKDTARRKSQLAIQPSVRQAGIATETFPNIWRSGPERRLSRTAVDKQPAADPTRRKNSKVWVWQVPLLKLLVLLKSPPPHLEG